MEMNVDVEEKIVGCFETAGITRRFGEIEMSPVSCAAPRDTSNISVRVRMLERIASSDAHFKHQQRDEPDLTFAEKFKISEELLDKNPATFLSRFGKYLTDSDLVYFNSMSDEYIIKFHLESIRKHIDNTSHQKLIKNHRYEAMKRLVAAGEYFSDDEMKRRDPMLYEEMVGQYLTDEEVNEQVEKSDLSLSNVLMKHIQAMENNKLYEHQHEQQECQMEEEESEEDDETEVVKSSDSLTDEEKTVLRSEFLATMQQRFLNGDDADFHYSDIDENTEYESIEIVSRDAEEKYFDDDS